MKALSRFISIVLIFAIIATFAACTNKPENDSPAADNPGYTDGADAGENGEIQHYIEVNREGTVEKIPVEIVEGIAADYTVAMDPEYFTFSSDGVYDTFTYENWGGSTNVYYCIYPNYDMTAQELADGLVYMYGDNYADCFTERAAVGMYDAIAVYLYDNLYNNDAQMRFYVIDTNYGCLVIECQFIAEMYEGLYAIMRASFDTLKLTDSGNNENQGNEEQNEPQNQSQSALSQLQKKITEEGALIGVAYLGYYDVGLGEAMDSFREESYWDEFSFLSDLTADRCVLAEGAEWYVIIPANDNVLMTVSEYYFDFEQDYIEGVNPGPGREYLSVIGGLPVLVRGNISDIMPNLIVRAEDGSVVEYTPCLSLENGRLDLYAAGVCDLTPYSKMSMFAPWCSFRSGLWLK